MSDDPAFAEVVPWPGEIPPPLPPAVQGYVGHLLPWAETTADPPAEALVMGARWASGLAGIGVEFLMMRPSGKMKWSAIQLVGTPPSPPA